MTSPEFMNEAFDAGNKIGYAFVKVFNMIDLMVIAECAV